MQRIGILFEYGTLNGGEHSMLAAIDHSQNRRCQFVILAPSEGALREETQKRNLPLEIVHLKNVEGQRVSKGDFSLRLNQIAAEFQIDIIHANSLTMGRHLGAVAKQLNVPTSSHIRDIMNLKRAAIRDLNQHQKLFAVSEATRDFHIKQGIEPDRVQRVYNGVDCERFQPRSQTGVLHKNLNLPEEAVLAATIGQICLRKAQVDLADAAVQLKDHLPNLHYLLVGERHSTKQESIEFDERITQTFAEAGMSNRLHRLGYVAEIPELFNEIDLLIHPARQEPLGRVLLEAAACGVPIVATSVGGTLEIIEDNKSALLVEPGNPLSLAAAIQQVVASPSLRCSLGVQARAIALAKFDIQHRANTLADAWEQVATS